MQSHTYASNGGYKATYLIAISTLQSEMEVECSMLRHDFLEQNGQRMEQKSWKAS